MHSPACHGRFGGVTRGVGMPDWPALMGRPLAARYCDMSPREFEGEVVAGHLPIPIATDAGERWRRVDIDQALERLAGGAVPDWRTGSKAYAQG